MKADWRKLIFCIFITCLKKLHHPDFASVSLSDRTLNNQKLREVVPKIEKLKTDLL
jgi:hypothetical protein